jgi:uncharacterized protein YegP (UPF0339 family)
MHFQLYRDATGHWRWRLVSSSDETIAASPVGYWNKADAELGIAIAKRAWSAAVFET